MIELFVINLEERIDRMENINNKFSNYKINFIQAIKHNEGWKGCFLSHKKCLQIAKELNLKYIIVLEDDCEPKENFDSNLKSILVYLENNISEWNIFLGAVTNVWDYNKCINLTSCLDLIEITQGKTYHFTIYNSNCYNFFLEREIDIPIDKCWYNNLKSYTCVPFLATQLIGFSDIEKKNINYDSRFNSVEKNFLKLLNKL